MPNNLHFLGAESGKSGIKSFLGLIVPEIQSTPMPTPVKVLIVEDEMIIAAKISMHLEELGYEVVGLLPRGEEAVVHCRQSPPDLLLLDINLKGILDGIETAKVLRKELPYHLPIIYLTANTDDATYERARATKPKAFIGKPYEKRELVRTIDLALLPGVAATPPLPAPSQPPEQPAYLLSDRIFVRHKKRMVKVFLKDINYVIAERAYCRIVTSETEYLLSMALSKLMDQVRSNEFMRVHRSHVVNLRHVDEVAERHLVVAGTAIPLGPSYSDELTRRLQLIHT